MARHQDAVIPDTPEQRAQLLRSLPEVELPPALKQQLERDPGLEAIADDWPRGAPGANPNPVLNERQLAYVAAREIAREKRDPDYAAFSKFYAKSKGERARNLPDNIAKWINAGQDWLPGVTDPQIEASRYLGRDSAIARLNFGNGSSGHRARYARDGAGLRLHAGTGRRGFRAAG